MIVMIWHNVMLLYANELYANEAAGPISRDREMMLVIFFKRKLYGDYNW